jgi:hypothetical protein
MNLTLATKPTKNSFCYHLVGFEKNIVYDCKNRSIMLTCSQTGAVLELYEKDEDLDFEDFVLVARNIFLDLIETFD